MPSGDPGATRYEPRFDGAEWAVWDVEAGNWVRLGRHAPGGAQYQFASEQEARRVAARLCAASPEDRRRLARHGMP